MLMAHAHKTRAVANEAENNRRKDELGLLLSLATKSREHDAALYVTYLLKAESESVKLGNEALRNCSKATKGMKGHKEGRPEEHLAAALLVNVITLGEKNMDDVDDIKFLLTNRAAPIDFEDEFLHCKFTETYAGACKFQLRVNPDAESTTHSAVSTMLDMMEKHEGADRKQGVAPRSTRERAIAARLEAMGKKS